MEAFNFAYSEITSAPESKKNGRTKSMRNRPDRHDQRNHDTELVQKISSILDREKEAVNDWQLTEWTEKDENGDFGEHLEPAIISDKDASGPDCPRSPLMLTKEEKETFLSEGIPLPAGWPFTKTEERTLKRVRRKIKNKLSAQESRRKKKEYIGSLEKKVEESESENKIMKHKVESLENTVKALLTELKRLSKNSLEKEERNVTTFSRGVQTGICLKCSLKKPAGSGTQGGLRQAIPPGPQ